MDSSAHGMSGRPSITVRDRQDLEDPCAFPNIVMDARQSTGFGAAWPSLTTRVRLGRFRRIPERRDGCNVQTVQTTDLPSSSRVLSTNPVKPTQPVSVSTARPPASRSSSAVEGRWATDETQRPTTHRVRLPGEKTRKSEPSTQRGFELSTQSSRTPSSRSPPLRTEK